MSMFSREDLERIKHDAQEPGPRSGGRNAIVEQVLPLAPAVARKPAIYTLDDARPQPEVPMKTEPVAASVPVKKKKVIITDMNTGVRRVEYR